VVNAKRVARLRILYILNPKKHKHLPGYQKNSCSLLLVCPKEMYYWGTMKMAIVLCSSIITARFMIIARKPVAPLTVEYFPQQDFLLMMINH